MLKKCTGCGVVKTYTEYSKARRAKDGYCHRCKECQRLHYQSTRDEALKKKKDYRERPEIREHKRVYGIEYRKRSGYRPTSGSKLSPEYQREYRRRPEAKERRRAKAAEYLQRRRARKAKVVSQLTQNEWLWLLEQSGYRCVYCGQHQDEIGTLAQEHVVPLAQGGAYTITNIVPACRTCNSRKQARTPTQAGMSFVIHINPLAHMKQKSLFEDETGK